MDQNYEAADAALEVADKAAKAAFKAAIGAADAAPEAAFEAADAAFDAAYKAATEVAAAAAEAADDALGALPPLSQKVGERVLSLPRRTAPGMVLDEHAALFFDTALAQKFAANLGARLKTLAAKGSALPDDDEMLEDWLDYSWRTRAAPTDSAEAMLAFRRDITWKWWLDAATDHNARVTKGKPGSWKKYNSQDHATIVAGVIPDAKYKKPRQPRDATPEQVAATDAAKVAFAAYMTEWSDKLLAHHVFGPILEASIQEQLAADADDTKPANASSPEQVIADDLGV